MEQGIILPKADDMVGWTREHCRLEQMRLRSELAFLHGDRMNGGPARDELKATLLNRLTALAARLTGDRMENLSHRAEQGRLMGEE